jgi:hypothetical protein
VKSDPGASGTSPITGDGVFEALDELCDRRASVLLATPYLSFPAHALERQGRELKLRVTLTEDFVKRTLAKQALRIRFPWGLGMLGGPVSLLGYGMEEGRRVLSVGAPAKLVDEDRRQCLRVEPPSSGSATLSPDGETLLAARVEDISPSGVRLTALEAVSGAFVPGRVLQLGLNLDPGPRLDAPARLVQLDGTTLRLSFEPPLGPTPQEALEAYLLPELERAAYRWENRAKLRAAAEGRRQARKAPEGVLLVGKDAALEAEVRRVLPEEFPLRTCPPALAPLREALDQPPKVVLLHVPGTDIHERRRFKALAEALPAATALVVLGAPGSAGGREVVADLKAATYLDWNPAQALFLGRLVQGLARKHWGPADS